jgi:hypothetical protein
MRFQVPQFIEIEDKIFGPLTFKQFIYLAGGVGLCVMAFIFLPNFIAFIIAVPIAMFAMGLAFYQMNGKPFIEVVEAFLRYYLGSKLYIWKKSTPEPKAAAEPSTEKKIDQVFVPKLSDSKLKELTWSLDIQENQNPVTPNAEEPQINQQSTTNNNV